MSKVLAITVQQDENLPATTTVPELESSPVPDLSNSPTHQIRTLPLPVPHLPHITFVVTPPVGHPFAELVASLTHWMLAKFVLKNKGRNLPAPLPVQPGPLLILMMVLWQEAHRLLEIRPYLTQTHQGRMWLTLIWTQPSETTTHAQTQMR